MAEPLRNSAVLVFDEFLAYLRQQGFVIGVDHYLRLQELLNKINGECGPAQLSTLLCPIFATSEGQQEKFYSAFSSFFALLHPPAASTLEHLSGNEQSGQADGGLKQSVAGSRWKKTAGVSAALVLVAAALAFFVITPGPIQNKNGNINQNGNRNENANRGTNSNSENRNKPNTNNSATQTPDNTDKPAPGPVADSSARPNVSTPSLPPLLGPKLRTFIRMAATGAPVFLFLIYEYFRYRRRKLVLQKQRARKPPFVYALRIEPPAHKIFNSEQFYTAARRMRRRQIDKFQRLDVRATVEATTRSLGYPSFRYKADSKIPEYLVLIDRASFRDHQAQLFENLARALKQEGLYVTTYFYDGDPRICCAVNGSYVQLSELQNKHADDRLLVFGDGNKMIDPLTGELESWTSIFSSWAVRGVLTPEALSKWGLRESSLAEQFAVVPANLSGLLAVVDYFENGAAIDPRLLTRNGHATLPGQFEHSDAVEELRSYLGEKTFQWLCACAVYPELQWGLTLYLGSLSCMETDLITEDSLLRLASLPWFRSGAIPDEIRVSLIRALDKEKERSIRAAIIELLERTPAARRAGQNSTADTYELNLAVESWFYHLDDRQRTRLRKVIVKLPQKEVFRDYTLIRFLESAPRTQLALLLPKKLRAIFYPSAKPEFGLRNSARLVLTAILVSIIWFGLNWLMPPISKARILDFSASAKTITAGETVKLFYGVRDASAVRINPEPGDVEVLEQNVIEVTPNETTTYVLKATDSDRREASRQLTIEVGGEGDLQITLFSASPQTIIPGLMAELSYEVRNASAVQINSESGSVYTDQPAQSPHSVMNRVLVAPSQTTVYTLTATGNDGKQATQTVTLTVLPPDAVRIDSFKADSPTINEGESTRLCYQVTNAIGGMQIVSNFGETLVVRNNCATVSPKQTTIYTLKATGSNSQQEQSLTVTVVPRDRPVIDEFSVTPSVIEPGGNVQFCYQVRNASVIQIEENQTIYRMDNSPGRICKYHVVSAPEGSITYTLKASSKNGAEVSAKLNVEVQELIITFGQVTVRPNPVIAGEPADLCAKVLNVSSIKDLRMYPAGEFVGTSFVGTSRENSLEYCFRIKPTETTTYTFTATSAGGQTKTSQFTLEVKQPSPKLPRIISFTASPSVVAAGETVNLCYEVENADGVTMSSTAGPQKRSSLIKSSKGYKTVLILAHQASAQGASRQFLKGTKNCIQIAPTQTTTYTIEAANDSGKKDSKSITVTVQEKPQRNVDPQQSAPSPSQQSGGSSTTGSLEGTVFDINRQPMPDVLVTVTNTLNGRKNATRTDEKGSFLLPYLPPGNYKVTASMRGYSDTTITVRVPLNKTTIIKPPDLTLRRAT